ncbi:MAG TPA: hypothetical protein VG755_34430 [Nannocystaceae bacterium]|nr:hypothetical protein [Nannocystaceae bacterium]
MSLPTLVLVLAAIAQEPSAAPPIQRPKSMGEPTPPEPVAPAPVEPIAPSEPSAPSEPVTPAPSERVEPTQSDPVPAPIAAPLGADESISAPIDDELATPPPTQRPISRAFRRPGIWVGVGAGLFVASAALHLAVPMTTGCNAERCDTDGLLALSLVSLPVDAATMTTWGFAGRSYGLRDARGSSSHAELVRRRRGALGGGIALVAAGVILTAGVFTRELVSDLEGMLSWSHAGMRIGGIALGSAGAALLGYAVALPRPGSDATVRLGPRMLRGGAALGVDARF